MQLAIFYSTFRPATTRLFFFSAHIVPVSLLSFKEVNLGGHITCTSIPITCSCRCSLVHIVAAPDLVVAPAAAAVTVIVAVSVVVAAVSALIVVAAVKVST